MGFVTVEAENITPVERNHENRGGRQPVVLIHGPAGFKILAEYYGLSGSQPAPANGGLAAWAQRRCIDLMHARLSEGVSLKELAAEIRLSPFHFARMFKQSVGVPPRVYLTGLRMEKVCELLHTTDLSVLEIALAVGYSSNQVLARVFRKHRHMSPTDYRRMVRNQIEQTSLSAPGAMLTTLEIRQ